MEPVSNVVEYTFADFLNENGLQMKIVLKHKNRKKATAEYYSLENADFGKFADSTSFSDAGGQMSMTSYKACLDIYNDLAEYLSVGVEIMSKDQERGVVFYPDGVGILQTEFHELPETLMNELAFLKVKILNRSYDEIRRGCAETA